VRATVKMLVTGLCPRTLMKPTHLAHGLQPLRLSLLCREAKDPRLSRAARQQLLQHISWLSANWVLAPSWPWALASVTPGMYQRW